MKNTPPFYLTVFFILAGIMKAGAQLPYEIQSVTGHLVRVTPKLADLDKYPTQLVLRPTRDEDGLIGMDDDGVNIHPVLYPSGHKGPDPLVQLQQNVPAGILAASATIGANFDGLGFTSVNPSDPNCAVGTMHVIQTINNSSSSYFKIWNKSGTQVQAQALISNLTGIQGAGDPVVLYDQLANRWVLTEFGYSQGITSFINTLIICISVTDDPTGSWYVYSFYDNTFFVDYPHYSVWHNGYYAISHDFNTSGTAYLGSSIYAFERTKMLAGDPTATEIRVRFNDPSGKYYSMSPVCVEGTATSSQSGLFTYVQDDSWTAAADVDSIFVMEFTPNFVTPGSSIIGAPTKLVTAPFDSELCTATRGQCISQQGSATKLEDLGGRLMHKIIYRNFGSYESMVCNLTVDADGAGKGGIRWWELRRTPPGAWAIYQEGTYAPDANHRWMGGISMDALGNIGLMYNVSGSTAFPSIRFTGRNSCDPLGTMTMPEQTVVAGTAANASTRYGDYNTLTTDPGTNLDFWMTAQYNPATSWSTRMATFRMNNCNPQPKIRFDSAMLAYREEDASVVSGCLKYKDYTVHVVIDAAPSQAATVTFNTSGTATNGIDYTVTPASVVLDAANLSRTVTIRVFDDAAVEGNESFSIGYTINAGGGNAVADVYNQSCLVNIVDNDNLPVPTVTSTQTWGSANVSAVTSGPFNGSAYTSKRIQNLYLASDILATGLKAGNVTNFQWNFYYPGAPNPQTFSNLVIKIGASAATTLATGFDNTPVFTTIYSGNFTSPSAAGWYNFTLGTPFAWNGTSNIIIETCWSNAAVTADNGVLGTTLAGYTPTALVRANGAGSQCAVVASNTSLTRPDIKLTIVSFPNPVATALNTSITAYLGPNADVPFYDGTGKIMARIKNLTAFDYGCTQVVIDRAGSTSSQFWNNSTTNYLASKTFKVIPANNTSSGHYQITLYYTAAEVSGWQTATTKTWSNAQMVKVSNGFFIPDVTPAVPHIVDVSLNSTTQTAYGSDYSITGDFNNTGFSGFGVGIPGNAQLIADYRTKATGNFTNGAIWQYNNEGAGYVDALQQPGSDNNATVMAGHTVSLDAGYSNNAGKTLTVSGTLNCGTNTVSGAGSFAMTAGGTLGIGSAAGITSSGATGNIQTATRTFLTTANYTYNGSVNQATGNGLPASINNLGLANTGGAGNNIVSLGSTLTVGGTSTLTSGIFSIGSNTLTLTGAAGYGTGLFRGSASSSLTINGAVGSVQFDQSSAANRSLNVLTVNSTGNGTLGSLILSVNTANLNPGGSFTVASGNKLITN